MLLKKSKIFSISAFLAVASCGSGPKVPVCISDGSAGLDCVDYKKKEYFVPFEKTQNWVVFSPDDFKTLLNYYKVKCSQSGD